MRLVPFQLIPDQGSVGYKLYQEAQKAKAEAAKAAAAAKAKPKVAPPKPTAAPAPTAPAKPAAPEKTATPIKETGLPEDEAMAFFLNGAKAKYKEAGDRTEVHGATSLGGQTVTAEQRRQAMGNPFVVLMKQGFDGILSSLGNYEYTLASMGKYQAKIADGDMSYMTEIANMQMILGQQKGFIQHLLEGIKVGTSNNTISAEAEEFFGEYTEFTRGEKLSLNELYERFDVA